MKEPKILIYDIDPYYRVIWNKISGIMWVMSNSSHKKGGYLTPRINANGYISFRVGKNWLPVHILLREQLFGKTKKGYTINHIDGNKCNNSKKNLEYITIAENIKHAVKFGLHVASDPKRSGRYKDGRAIKSRVKQYKHEWYERKKQSKNTSI